MKCDIKVSVIVAVYNADKFLRQCLDSIVHQTLSDIEIICINDGSTDSSGEILQEYSDTDKRIRVYNKQNKGLGGASARNFGLKHAKGEYISILDSDDFFDLCMLERATRKADATNADLVVFGGYEYDDETGYTYPANSILNVDILPLKEVFSYHDCPECIFQISSGMAWNKLYRRSFLEQFGLEFQEIKYTDDAYFTFSHMILAERISVLRDKLCYYRVNSGVNQTAGLSRYPDSAYLPYLKLKKSLIEWNVYKCVERSFLNCAVSFMRYFYDKIDNYRAFSYLHNKFRESVFDELGIDDKPIEFFFHSRTFQWCQQILKNGPEEIAFRVARAYGSDCTTCILRFGFPYDHIPKGSRIVLVGAGIMATHYYAQMVLTGYCEVVACISQENPLNLPYRKELSILSELNFDYALIACEKASLVQPAVEFLKKNGVSDHKIVLVGS